MNLEKLKEELKLDEGYRNYRYKCSAGFWTIGWGHNLSARGQEHIKSCTEAEAEEWLEQDIDEAEEIARAYYPDFDLLTDARQRVLVNMSFCLGRKINQFVRMKAMMRAGAWELAAKSIMDSKFAKQTGARAKRLARLMREG